MKKDDDDSVLRMDNIDNNNNNNNNENMDDCKHTNSSSFSGDLVCLTCGKVLQANSQLSMEPFYLEPDYRHNLPSNNNNNTTPSLAFHKLSHQEREEISLKLLARKLISSFALKTSYEREAIELMHRYWLENGSRQRYGMCGGKLLVASIFLLARRDHLAVNLGLLAASIDSNSQTCGSFFEGLVRIDPGLKSLARVEDYTERAVDLMVSHLFIVHHLKIIDLHGLKETSKSIASILQNAETGSSKSAEATALASSSIALASLLQKDSQEIDLESSVLPRICEFTNVSFKMVKIKRTALLEKLMERAVELLPSTFSIKMTRKMKNNLLFQNLDNLL